MRVHYPALAAELVPLLEGGDRVGSLWAEEPLLPGDGRLVHCTCFDQRYLELGHARAKRAERERALREVAAA
jgi:hypothetical protein